MKDYAPKNYRIPDHNNVSRVIAESIAICISITVFVALILYDVTGGLPA